MASSEGKTERKDLVQFFWSEGPANFVHVCVYICKVYTEVRTCEGQSRWSVELLTSPLCDRMDQVCEADQGAYQQPWHTAATGAYEQDRSQPQAFTTG